MANRDLTVKIDGDPKGFISAARRSSAEAKRFAAELDRIEKKRNLDNLRRAAEDSSKSFSDLFANVGKMGPASVGLLAAAIVALPATAAVAAAGVTAALGGGLAAVGLVAAAQSARVRGEFSALADDVGHELGDIASPLEQSLLKVPGVARRVLRSVEPELEGAFEKLAPKIDSFVERIGDGATALEPALDPLADGFGALLDAIGGRSDVIFGNLADAVTELAETTEEHADDIAAMLEIFSGAAKGTAEGVGYLADEWDRFLVGLETWADFAGAARGDLDNSGEAVRRAGQGAADALVKWASLAEAMDDTRVSASKLKAELDDLNGAALDADEAASRYQEAIDRADESVKKNGRTLSLNTEKGRENRDSIREIARAAQDHIVAMADENRSVEEIGVQYETYRGQLYNSLRAAGATRAEAKRLTEQWLDVPKSILTNARANTKQAWAAMGSLIARMEKLRNGVTVPVYYYQYGPGLSRASGASGVLGQQSYMQRKAGGGPINGPGTGTSDSILLWGSDGEYMINAKSTRKYRPLIEAINADKFAAGGPVGRGPGGYPAYADGGPVDAPLSEYVERFMGGKPLSRTDYAKVVRSRADAVDQLRRAERKLAADRRAHKSAKTIADDEARVAKERRDLLTATEKLTAATLRYKRSKLSPVTRLRAALDLGIKNSGAFIRNLEKIASRGFPELARQLLAMGGPEAEAYARDAAKLSTSKLKSLAGKVATAARNQAKLEALPNILAVKAARKAGAKNIPQVMKATGLSEDDLKETYAAMGYARGGIHRYARGGVRPGPGIATRPVVMFGEGRAPEGFVPYDPAHRTRAVGLVSQMARDFGMSRPAGGGRVVVTLDVVGADSDLKRMIRKMVRIDGRGDVQVAFGKSA